MCVVLVFTSGEKILECVLKNSKVVLFSPAFCFMFKPHILLFGTCKHLELMAFKKLDMERVKSVDIFKFIK